jgi:hypothetical protein
MQLVRPHSRRRVGSFLPENLDGHAGDAGARQAVRLRRLGRRAGVAGRVQKGNDLRRQRGAVFLAGWLWMRRRWLVVSENGGWAA